MIKDTKNMAYPWRHCMRSREDIIEETEYDAKYVDGTEYSTPGWDWEGTPHFDLYGLANASIEAAMIEILEGLV